MAHVSFAAGDRAWSRILYGACSEEGRVVLDIGGSRGRPTTSPALELPTGRWFIDDATDDDLALGGTVRSERESLFAQRRGGATVLVTGMTRRQLIDLLAGLDTPFGADHQVHEHALHLPWPAAFESIELEADQVLLRARFTDRGLLDIRGERFDVGERTLRDFTDAVLRAAGADEHAACRLHARPPSVPRVVDVPLVPSALVLESNATTTRAVFEADGTVHIDGEVVARIFADGRAVRVKNGVTSVVGRLRADRRFVDARDKVRFVVDEASNIFVADVPDEPLVRFREDHGIEGIVGLGRAGDGLRYVGAACGRLAAALAIIVWLNESLAGFRC